MWRGRRKLVLLAILPAAVLVGYLLQSPRGSRRAPRLNPVRRADPVGQSTSSPMTLSSPPAMSATLTTPAVASAITYTDAQSGVAGAAASAAPGSSAAAILEIRAVLVDNPTLAEELARAHRERFPDSPDADERDALLVAAIFNQHRLWEARQEARNYLQQHPSGQFADFLMNELHVHYPRHRGQTP